MNKEQNRKNMGFPTMTQCCRGRGYPKHPSCSSLLPSLLAKQGSCDEFWPMDYGCEIDLSHLWSKALQKGWVLSILLLLACWGNQEVPCWDIDVTGRRRLGTWKLAAGQPHWYNPALGEWEINLCCTNPEIWGVLFMLAYHSLPSSASW